MTNITKEQLLKELNKKDYTIRDLEQQIKISKENEETHKKASFNQVQDVKKIQLERDEIKKEHEKLIQAYNGLAQIFDEYLFVTKNSLQQLEGLTKASVMLEKQITQKIENINKGVENK